MIDFVGLINETVTALTQEQKAEMLDDFCDFFGYVAPGARKAWANARIEMFIRNAVNGTRKRRAALNVVRLDFGLPPIEPEPPEEYWPPS